MGMRSGQQPNPYNPAHMSPLQSGGQFGQQMISQAPYDPDMGQMAQQHAQPMGQPQLDSTALGGGQPWQQNPMHGQMMGQMLAQRHFNPYPQGAY